MPKGGKKPEVQGVDGLADSKDRAVRFLDDGDLGSESRRLFDDLRLEEKRGLLYSMELWLRKVNQPKRHHGFDPGEYDGRYVDCHVLKFTGRGGKMLRLYGYKIRIEQGPAGYLALILILLKQKKGQHEVEERDLSKTKEIGEKTKPLPWPLPR